VSTAKQEPSRWPALACLLTLVLAIACRTTTTTAVPQPPTDVTRLPTFDPAAQVAGLPTAPRSTPLRVRDVRPWGPGDGAGIRLRFDRLVVDPSAAPVQARLVVQRVSSTGELVEVPTTSRWTRGDTLEAMPRDPLPAAHTYRVALEGGDALVDGGIAATWTFETPRPELSLAESWWSELRRRAPIFVQSTQPIAAANLAAHLVVRARPRSAEEVTTRASFASAPRIDVRVREATARDWPEGEPPAHLLVVEPRRDWPAAADVELAVSSTLRGSEGPLGLVDAWRATTTTEDVLAIGALGCSGGLDERCPVGPIEIPTGVEVVNPSKVRVEPALAGLSCVTSWSEAGEPVITIDGAWVEGRRYTITMPSTLRDDDGERLGRAQRRTVRFDDALTSDRRDLQLSPVTGIFVDPAEARVGIRGSNVRSAEVRLAVVPASAAAPLLHARTLTDVAWPSEAREHTIALRPEADARLPGTMIVDLGKYASLGEVVLVEVRAVDLHPGLRGEPPTPVRGLFSLSSLGVSVQRGATHGFVRVTSMATGDPIADAEVVLHERADEPVRRRTDRHGVARLPAVDLASERAHVVVAHGSDALLLPVRPVPLIGAGAQRFGRMTPAGRLAMRPEPKLAADPTASTLRLGEIPAIATYVGRGLFMPGDRVDVAGWATISTPHASLSTRRAPAGTPVRIELRSEDRDRVVARVDATVDAHGRFWARTRVPSVAPLGRYTAVARLLGGEGDASFVVSEARIPAFEVAVRPRREAIVRGDDLGVDFAATLLSGSATAIDSARIFVDCAPTGPRLMRSLPEGFVVHSSGDADGLTRVFHRKRSADGTLEIVQPTDVLDPRRPMRCAIDIAAVDMRLHEIGAVGEVHVDPAATYLALAVPANPAIGRQEIRVLAVDLTGRPVAQSGIELAISSVVRDVESAPIHRCRLDVGADGEPGLCRTPRLAAGTHRLRATTTVDGTPIELVHDLWIPAPAPKPEREDPVESPPPPPPPVADETPFAIDELDAVVPGRVVPVVVRGPWSRATGVLAVEQTGLREVIPFEMKDGIATVHTRATAGRGPTLALSAHVTPPPSATSGAQEVVASRDAGVDHLDALKVAVVAPEHARPRQRVPIEIRVVDGRGAPTDARVAVWVVDEGVHMLRAPTFSLGWFFDANRTGERASDRSFDRIAEPFDGWMYGRSVRAPQVRQAAASVKGSLGDPVGRHFDPAPLFVGNVGTGPDGKVEVTLPLPDDLTRYRIEAIASASVPGHPESGPVRFGVGQGTIAVATPLELRAALPRALRPSDSVTIGAVVTVPSRGELDVGLEIVGTDGVIAIEGPAEHTVIAEPGTRRVDFRVTAAQVGTATVRLSGVLRPDGGGAPIVAGVEHPLRVQVDRTQLEIAAHDGSLDADTPVAIPVALPERAIAGHGSIAVRTSATTIGELDAAAEYLVDYPYECLEQTSSRLMPIVAFAGLPGGHAQRGPAIGRATELVARIAAMQRDDGELTYWPGTSTVDRHASAYALWVLYTARDRGIEVDEGVLSRATKAVLARLDRTPAARAFEGQDEVWLDEVAALHALAPAGVLQATDFDPAFEHRASLPPFGRTQLLMALHRAAPDDARLEILRNDLSALIEERQGVAHVTEPRARHEMAFDSAARDDALALMAMLQVAPEDPRIDKLARGLRDRRRGGRWRTTQENALALLALSDYARAREPEVPRHHLEGWIGSHRVIDAAVNGRSTTTRSGSVALDALVADRRDDNTVAVIVGREGQGRTHYRVEVTWAEPDPPARAQGLSLARRIVDERGAPVQTLRAGERYRLEVELETSALQHHIAVEVPLPLGLEPVDAELGAAARARVTHAPTSPDLSHSELRPDRVLLFFDTLPGGRHVHTVPLFAVTAGTFAMPPAVAEAMYEPETRARTTSDEISIAAPP
jgi:hypothetical protein